MHIYAPIYIHCTYTHIYTFKCINIYMKISRHIDKYTHTHTFIIYTYICTNIHIIIIIIIIMSSCLHGFP